MEQTGFEEIEHTADWALRVWAPDLPGLLQTAARGMYRLAATTFADGNGKDLAFTLQGDDPEMLLVGFLDELLFLGETQGMGAEEFDLEIELPVLKVRALGREITRQKKEIKAVTYHDLAVLEKENGLETTIVFDV